MTQEIIIDDDGPLELPRPNRLAEIHTSVSGWYEVHIRFCRQHEAKEILDLLRSRGWII